MAEPDLQPKAAVVGVFEDRSQAERAVDALERAGFTPAEIGYIIRGSSDAVTELRAETVEPVRERAAFAGMLEGGMIGGVLAALFTLFIPGIGPVIVGGLLASFFGGALAGSAVGGILAALTSLGVSEERARLFATHFRQGRAIIAVRAGLRSSEAARVLLEAGGQHIHEESEPQADRPDDAYSTPYRNEGERS